MVLKIKEHITISKNINICINCKKLIIINYFGCIMCEKCEKENNKILNKRMI